MLEDHPDVTPRGAQIATAQRGELAAGHDDLAAGGPAQKVDDPYQRAFPGAAAANDAKYLTRRDRQVNASQRLDRPLGALISLNYFFEFDHESCITAPGCHPV
jgi:hypothetical protein